MPRPTNTVRNPDLFGVGAIRQAARCAGVTARALMIELKARGEPGIYVTDNATHLVDRRGLRACVVEFANRTQRGGVGSG